MQISDNIEMPSNEPTYLSYIISKQWLNPLSSRRFHFALKLTDYRFWSSLTCEQFTFCLISYFHLLCCYFILGRSSLELYCRVKHRDIFLLIFFQSIVQNVFFLLTYVYEKRNHLTLMWIFLSFVHSLSRKLCLSKWWTTLYT